MTFEALSNIVLITSTQPELQGKIPAPMMKQLVRTQDLGDPRRENAADRLSLKLLLRGLLLAVGCGVCLPAATAPLSTEPAQASQDSGPAAIDALVEERIATPLRLAVSNRRDSAAVVLFIRDGKVRIREAEGFEDSDQRVPVTASESLFQVGSISKTLVGVALAQLKASGRIASYDDPANRYLKTYQLPDSDGQAITLRQLATHTSGLDYSIFGEVAFQPQPGTPTAADFKRHQPPYSRPPGEFTAYSSFGADILGLLIADVSGMPYTDYLETAILKPLGMTNTVAGYPPGGRMAHEVRSYDTLAGRQVHPNFYAFPFARPSFGVFTTADDMGRYMLALLDRSPDQKTITPAMQDSMFQVLHEDAPKGSAHGLIFELMRTPSSVEVYHAGSSETLACLLAMVPVQRSGLFLCLTVSPPLAGLPANRQPLQPGEVVSEALNTLVAGADQRPAGSPGERRDEWNPAWNAYLGDFISTLRQHSGIGRLRSILHPPQTIRVARGSSGLAIAGIDGLREVSPGVFQPPGSPEYFAFLKDPRTGQTLLSRTTEGSAMYEQPRPQDDPRLMLKLLAAAIAIGVTGLFWPLWPGSRHALLARAAAVLFGMGVTGATLAFGTHPFGDRFLLGISWPIILIRVFGFLVIPAAVLLCVAAVAGWNQGLRQTPALARAHLLVLVLGAWFAVGVLADVGVFSLMIH